jgi:cytochrome c556
MKAKWIILPAVGIVAWAVAGTFAQPKVPLTTKEFMREKLGHSQRVLEALAVEDFFTLEQHAKKLSAMTEETSWQAFQNPDYTQHSATFRRHANALTRAAQDRDLDAAALAYVRLTMSCIECHKMVRGKLLATSVPGQEFALAAK